MPLETDFQANFAAHRAELFWKNMLAPGRPSLAVWAQYTPVAGGSVRLRILTEKTVTHERDASGSLLRLDDLRVTLVTDETIDEQTAGPRGVRWPKTGDQLALEREPETVYQFTGRILEEQDEYRVLLFRRASQRVAGAGQQQR